MAITTHNFSPRPPKFFSQNSWLFERSMLRSIKSGCLRVPSPTDGSSCLRLAHYLLLTTCVPIPHYRELQHTHYTVSFLPQYLPRHVPFSPTPQSNQSSLSREITKLKWKLATHAESMVWKAKIIINSVIMSEKHCFLGRLLGSANPYTPIV